MLVNDGKLLKLNDVGLYLAGLYWGLFTNNATISATTTFAALTEATWTGYARVIVGVLGSAAIVANKAVAQPVSQPSFGNTSGSNQQFYGWFLYDTTAGKLVAAQNIGLTNLPSGGTFPMTTAFTDDTA